MTTRPDPQRAPSALTLIACSLLGLTLAWASPVEAKGGGHEEAPAQLEAEAEGGSLGATVVPSISVGVAGMPGHAPIALPIWAGLELHPAPDVVSLYVAGGAEFIVLGLGDGTTQNDLAIAPTLRVGAAVLYDDEDYGAVMLPLLEFYASVGYHPGGGPYSDQLIFAVGFASPALLELSLELIRAGVPLPNIFEVRVQVDPVLGTSQTLLNLGVGF